MHQLELELKPKNNGVDSLLNKLTIRRGTYGKKLI
jgi:hypothetical protein